MSVNLSQKLEKAQSEERRRFIRLVITEENDINGELEDLNDEIVKLVQKNGSNPDPDRINAGLKSIFAAWAGGYVSYLINKNVEAAKLSTALEARETREAYQDPFRTRDTEKKGQQYWSTFPRNGFTGRRNLLDGITVGQRIKTVETGSLKTVQNIIYTGIKDGKSAKQLAADISGYVVKDVDGRWVSPYQYYRSRFGYKVNKVPKGIPAGSMQYNAVRIARTEINNTWREATLRATKDQPWVTGYTWNLSGSHPATDICDDLANGSPYTRGNVPMTPHPHCMCYLTTERREE